MWYIQLRYVHNYPTVLYKEAHSELQAPFESCYPSVRSDPFNMITRKYSLFYTLISLINSRIVTETNRHLKMIRQSSASSFKEPTAFTAFKLNIQHF